MGGYNLTNSDPPGKLVGLCVDAFQLESNSSSAYQSCGLDASDFISGGDANRFVNHERFLIKLTVAYQVPSKRLDFAWLYGKLSMMSLITTKGDVLLALNGFYAGVLQQLIHI